MTEITAPPGRRAQKTAATRRAIAEAAIELFVEQGYGKTTIDEIADRAGVSRRSFFNYFETKQAAAFPDHEARIEMLETSLTALPEVSLESAARLVIDEVERFTADPIHRHRYRLLLHIPELREHDMRDDLDYEDVFTRHFLRSTREPSADQRFAARLAASRIIGAYRAALFTWAEADDDFDPAVAIADMVVGTPD